MLADALVEGAVEFIVGPGADAVGFVRGDVGRIERAIRGTERRASGVGAAARRGVAGFAIARAREIGAPFHNRGIRGVRCVGRSGKFSARAYHQNCDDRVGAGFDPLHRISQYSSAELQQV